MLISATLNGDLTADNGNGTDTPGVPAFNSLTFGGGDVGGTVTTNTAPASVALAGGTLQVNADGSFSLTNPTMTGSFTFQYRLSNTIPAFDDATVTILVGAAPIAMNDSIDALVGSNVSYGVGKLFQNNGFGPDLLGVPAGDIVSFGAGSILGSALVTDFADGATTPAGSFAGGELRVNADGSLTIFDPTLTGNFTFQYRLQNAFGFDDGTVTVSVYEAPVAQNDVFQFFYTVDQSAPNSLFASNGFGPDNLGFPSATIAFYGAGSLGGSVIDHAAGTSAPLAGGILTVNGNGSWSLTGALFTPGLYTFQYFLQNLASSSVATVTLNIVRAPDAVDDLAFTVASGGSFNFVPPDDLLVNDDRGFPLANVVSYGGGDAGGDITTFAANTSTSNFPGYTPGSGFLQINGAGTGIFTPPMLPSPFCGEFDFAYRLANSIPASDDAAVRVTVTCLPVANDDAFNVLVGAPLTGDLNDANGGSADILGFPVATISTFGGGSLGGTVADNGAGASVALAGGTLTVNADGTFSLNGTSVPGDYSFQYQLSSALPASDLATVTIQVRQTPVAVDDLTYAIGSGSTLTFTLANGVLFNDTVGYPVATVESFGGLDAGGTVTTNPAGTMLTPLGGDDGHLRIFADGTGTFEARTSPGRFCGSFDFQYRLSNGVSFDDANVSIAVACPPVARDDTFNSGFTPGVNGVGLTGDLNSDNGHGADSLSAPAATITSFTLGTVGTPVAFAGGTITVNADGTFTLVDADTPGTHTFNYTLSNLAGSSSALVTFVIDAPPQVFSTTPADAATLIPRDTNITIDFTEQVNIAAGGVTVTCGAGALAFAPSLPVAATDPLVINPAADLPANTVCTVTVLSASVADSDTNDAPNNLDGDNSGVEGGDFVFSFQTRPEAVDDTYNVTPHLTFDSTTPAFSVRDNDIPASVAITGFGPTSGTANGTAANGTNFITAGGAGGRVVLNADGTFLFYPDRLDSNTATTFFYTVTGGDTAQVTLNIQNQELIWFVDNDATGTVCLPSNANLGTQACPEDTLREITGHGLSSTPSIDTANDTIFIRNDGDDAPYLCGVPLESGEKIIGDGTSVAGETLASLSGVTPVNGSSLPSFSGSDPTFTDGAGSCLLINANNTMRGFTIGSTVSYALFSNVANIGTTSIRDVSINGANGLWILGSAGTLNAEFNTLTSNGSNIAVLNGIGGTITNSVSSSITTTTGGIFVTGSDPSWTYTGNVTKTGAGRLVNINGTTGGTLAFPGTLTQDVTTPTNGILIDNQTGGTVSFGTINLGQTNPISGTGVTITDGSSTSTVNLGTLNLRQVGGATSVVITEYDGTVTSTAGTISSTNIQAININGPVGLTTLGMTLTSVSSNGGANGIFIQDTNGSFTVTGNGTTDASGGTIQNITNRGGSFISATNISLSNMNFINANTFDNAEPAEPAVALGNNASVNGALHFATVTGVTLDNLNITSSVQQGINGHTVNNFTLRNSALLNLGTGADEDGLHFFNMLGTNEITNTTITSSGDDNVNIQNNSGTSTITITGGSFNTGVLGSGLLFGPRGTNTTTINISGVTSNNNFSGGVVADASDTADMNITVTNSTITNNNDGIQISAASGDVDFDVDDNDFVGNDFLAINILKAAFSTGGTLDGYIRNNNPITIANGITADAIMAFQAGGGRLAVAITGNTINYAGTQRAILLQAGQDGNGTLQATVAGNTIDIQLDGAGNAVAGVLAQASITSPEGDGASMCLDFGGSTAPVRNTFTHSLGGTIAAGDLRVRQRLNGTYRLPGYLGGATDTAAVSTFLNGRNTFVSAPTATAESSGFAGGAACTQP